MCNLLQYHFILCEFLEKYKDFAMNINTQRTLFYYMPNWVQLTTVSEVIFVFGRLTDHAHWLNLTFNIKQ